MINRLMMCVFLLLSFTGKGQMIYDTLDLKTVEIFGPHHDLTAGYKIQTFDSLKLATHSSDNLADLLTSGSAMFIKNYGQGMLATSSIRGGSASHTQVMWNGLNINSPMPGQSDFSAIPVFFADEISLLPGNGSIYHTSGGLGGSINMQTLANWHNKLNINLQQELASFETSKTMASLNAGNNNLQYSGRFYYGTSKNNFPYPDISISRENPPEKYRNNASWTQAGTLQQIFWKPAPNTRVSTKVWWQDNTREVPSNMLINAPAGNEQLSEQFVRALAGIQHFFPTAKFSFQSGYIYNHLNYINKISAINSENDVNSSLNNLLISYLGIKNLLIDAKASYDYHNVRSNNYEGLKTRSHASVSVGLNYSGIECLKLNVVMRQEYIDNNTAPFTPSIAARYQPFDNEKIFIKASAARNFHAPTLNDLYWSPGGNPNLKNETGWSFDLGLSYGKSIEKIDLKAELTCFYSDIENRIIWLPDSVFSYWTPSNLRNVISQGVEASLNLEGQISGIDLNYDINYSFTSARNINTVSSNDQSINKQLIYIPKNMLQQTAGIGYSGFLAVYRFNMTGKRYTTSDNLRYLPHFTVQDIWISKKIDFGQSECNIRFTVENFTDENYQVVAWHPMPGRHYRITLKYFFNQTK